MDIATIIGIIFGLFCIIWSILINSGLRTFYDFASIVIVLGGGISASLISYKLSELNL